MRGNRAGNYGHGTSSGLSETSATWVNPKRVKKLRQKANRKRRQREWSFQRVQPVQVLFFLQDINLAPGEFYYGLLENMFEFEVGAVVDIRRCAVMEAHNLVFMCRQIEIKESKGDLVNESSFVLLECKCRSSLTPPLSFFFSSRGRLPNRSAKRRFHSLLPSKR